MSRYSPAVVEHFTNPRNGGEVENADVRAFVGNPVCGDQILLSARISDGVVTEIRFRAHGCAPALAAASLITEQLQGNAPETVDTWEPATVAEMLGRISPEQRHVAVLGAQVARRLVENYRQGTNDDDPITCAE